MYNDNEFDGQLVRPRVRRSWPVLKLPKGHPANTDPLLGAINQGCDEEHCGDPGCRTYTMRWDEFSDENCTASVTNTGTDASATPAQYEPQQDTVLPQVLRVLPTSGRACSS